GGLCDGDRRAWAHRQAGGDQRRAYWPIPAGGDRGRGPAQSPRLLPLPARARSRSTPVHQRFREAAGHALTLRPATVADAREEGWLPRSLVGARRADGHAQLVSGDADRRAEGGRDGGPGKRTEARSRAAAG